MLGGDAAETGRGWDQCRRGSLCNGQPHHDVDDDDEGYPAYSHQSYSHQVGICHNDEGWEYDTINFPPYLFLMISLMMRGWGYSQAR